MNADPSRGFLFSVVTLRGAFVLLVCAFHFSAAAMLYLPCHACVEVSYALARPASYAFFILSGFGITWSLHLARYSVRHAGRFYLKRLMRLEPPYLAAIAATLLVHALVSRVPGYGGRPFALDWERILLHVGYLIPLSGHDWLNPAFWTLAVEFQFYLLAAWAYPLFVHADARVRNAALAAGVLAHALLPHHAYSLASYAPLFLIGIVLCQWHAGIGGRLERIAWLCALLAVTLDRAFPPAMLGFAVLTLAMILKRDHYSRVGHVLGEISYSVYLLHAATAYLGIKLLHFWSSDLARFATVALCYALTFAAAGVFYLLVERPSHRWSQRLRYPRRDAAPAATVPAPGNP